MKSRCRTSVPGAPANPARDVILPGASLVRTLCLAALPVIAVTAAAQAPEVERDLSETVRAIGNWDWPVYLGDQARGQYSPLAQINATNVHRLQPAWEYRAGDAAERSTMYSNPLIVDGVLYAVTPSLNAVALDAATGKRIWIFDPSVHNGGTVIRQRNRGVTYWKGAEGERVFHFVRDRAYAIDARSGELIRSFGSGGYIDLRENLGVDPRAAALQMTTPGAVYKNLLILGCRVNESYGSSPGPIRAFNAVTGELEWAFHTIPRRGELGHDTWSWPEGESFGGGNAWSGVTIDEERGWVFVGTGAVTDDFYGAFRKGANLFANSVVALDAATGERKWHYQVVRHDIWDYDLPAAPILATLRSGGGERDAVVQLTKMGLTFVLDRDTGEPIFPVYDRPVPSSDVPGEEAWPTQPFPVKPPPLGRIGITEADLTNITPEAREHALREFRKYRSGSIYTPPSLQGTLTMPGHLGGSQWNGGSFDPQLNTLYVNVNEAPTIGRLRPAYGSDAREQQTRVQEGRQIYETNCMACHGSDRRGTSEPGTSLVNLGLSREDLDKVISDGRNLMPAYPQFGAEELDAIAAYIDSVPDTAASSGATRAHRYSIDGYAVFRDPHGVPAIAPPWGTLNAIDLLTGEIRWKVPLGEYPRLAAKGIRDTGTMNFGGAVATAGGVIFVAATADEKFRAFEKHSGRVLWEYQLPAGGYATPSVYQVEGKQYVAIAAGGGGKNGTKSGDSIIAFALPEQEERVEAGSDWIELFDGKTLDGWVHMNGFHNFTVEDGAIVGRTVEGSARMNSFLCSLRQFDDFELEAETYLDPITNSGIQVRTKIRPMAATGDAARGTAGRAGRVNGPQMEIRRYYPGQPTTGVLYGEALGIGWMSSQAKIDEGHQHYIPEGWNRLRIVAKGPRIQTWVNGQMIEDLVNEEVYKTHKRGFIGLQVHGINENDIARPVHAGKGITTSQPLIVKWRNIRVRPLARDD